MVNWVCLIHRKTQRDRWPRSHRGPVRVGFVPPLQVDVGVWWIKATPDSPSVREFLMPIHPQFRKLRRAATVPLLATSLVYLMMTLASGADATPLPTLISPASESKLAQKYGLAGEGLASKRSPDKSWGDGEQLVGRGFHSLPVLPLEPNARIWPGCMTCAQWKPLT